MPKAGAAASAGDASCAYFKNRLCARIRWGPRQRTMPLRAWGTMSRANETELVEAFLRRKYRGKQLGAFLKEEKNLAAAFRRLRYAGFSAGASIRVLKRYAEQADILDVLESEDSDGE